MWSDAPKRNVVVADEAGRFELTNLPAEPIEIMASDGPRFAKISARPDEKLELRLPPAPAPVAAEKLEELWRATKIEDFSRLDPYYEILGPKRLFETARRLDGAGKSGQAGGALDEYLKMRAGHARTLDERENCGERGRDFAVPVRRGCIAGRGRGGHRFAGRALARTPKTAIGPRAGSTRKTRACARSTPTRKGGIRVGRGQRACYRVGIASGGGR